MYYAKCNYDDAKAQLEASSAGEPHNFEALPCALSIFGQVLRIWDRSPKRGRRTRAEEALPRRHLPCPTRRPRTGP